MSEKKVIKYFGAHYCPHSNKNSRAYNLINNLIAEKYKDVEIELYMSEEINEDNKHEFIKARAEYVPTITNGKYVHINLSLPQEFITDDKTDEEILEELLENIYNQLDKEPEKSVDNFEPVLNVLNEDTGKKPKCIFKNMMVFLNNTKVVKVVCIILIILIILVPFLRNCKK